MPAAEKNAHASTQAATIIATIAMAAACVLPLVPAININLEALQAQGVAWTASPCLSVNKGL
jgi:hypothetical protein